MATKGQNNSCLYDLAVIGAGPAGSYAAALAANAGLKTVLIEKYSHPRPKTCGGFISARALGLLPHDLNLSPVRGTDIYDISVNYSSHHYNYRSTEKLGLLVKRESFDQLLANYALQKGADLIQGASLQGLSTEKSKQGLPPSCLLYCNLNEKEIRARYVIGADGAYSKTAILSGLKSSRDSLAGLATSTLTSEGATDNKPGSLVFYPLPFLGGMGWSFHGNGWINRGVGGLAGRERIDKAYHKIFKAETEILKTGVKSWPLPFCGPIRKPAAGNIILIGDAAGLIDPYSGEGLFNSFLSSILAVNSIIRTAKRSGDAAPVYRKLFNTYFRRGFPLALAGAAVLHGISIIKYSRLPQIMAMMMQSKHPFSKRVENDLFDMDIFDKIDY